MKKSTMIKTLESPISRADIKLKDGQIIFYGFSTQIITYNDRFFTYFIIDSYKNMQTKYSDVKSIEVFE